MLIKSLSAGPLETNAYFVLSHSNEGPFAMIIDPAPDSADWLLSLVKESKTSLLGIFLTHSHFDHIHDVAKVMRESKTDLFVHEKDAENVRKVGSDGLPNMLNTESSEPTHLLKGGEILSLGQEVFHVIPTPGHSPGGVCYYFPEKHVLFSGDTLFKGTYGRVDLPGANEEAMKSSLQSLAKLPNQTVVYPGHGSETTIEKERSWICV